MVKLSNNKKLKSDIRARVRQQRQNLSPKQKSLASYQLVSQLKKHQLLAQYQHIACFLSFDGEISTQHTIQQIFDLQKSCYLPKLRPYKPNQLWFMPFNQDSRMKTNRFGICEVDQLPNHAIALSSLDLVLVPLVAFDTFGSRLGMGGGFYDATFAHLKASKTRPRFIGLAYQNQLVDDLPSDPWDIPLDGVCTEQDFYSF